VTGAGEDAVHLRAQIDEIYRTESRRVLATLIRLLGDFERAEDAVHDAFIAAVEQWGATGIPADPRRWLVSAGRFKAIDALRRRARFDASLDHIAEALHNQSEPEEAQEVEDDQLRLVFTCCHPALPIDAQVALTLREVCGLTTEAIAAAFLVPPSTVAQRIVRAKQKIRQARIPYTLPAAPELPARLDAVLQVLYLVFNEGYAASAGPTVVRHDLTAEAIRLCRALVTLLPHPEVQGLLGLMLLHDARRDTRMSATGQLVLLEDQDRSRWHRAQIVEGAQLVEGALRSRRFGPFTLQGAIAAVHAEAPTAEATDWAEIVGLYDVLRRVDPSPIVQLNRAVAIAMRDGARAGLTLITPLLEAELLGSYALAHAAAGELHRRLGERGPARAAYARALALTRQEAERRFLQGRLDALESAGGPAS
jgi:RNA polymerase sigma-70 factor (ECF subfamily)